MRPVAFLILSLSILMAIWLAGCSSDTATPTPTAVPATPAPTPAPTAAAAPTPTPAPAPTEAPTAMPTPTATPVPTSPPTPTPRPTPTRLRPPPATPAPTEAPTPVPTPEPTPAPTPEPTPDPVIAALAGIPGIIDPTNLEWPREVEGLNGVVRIPVKPFKIITASIGHDEIVVALAPIERLAAVGSVSKDATYSNVAHLVQDKPEISRDPEVILTREPDVIVTSPWFPADTIEALTAVGIPAIQTALKQGLTEQINNILFIGYILGEEERALAFAAEVRERYESLTDVTAPAEPKPKVLALTSYSDNLWTAGGGSTEGGVIVAAGGVNAAEEAGIDGNQITSLEGIIAMNPDVIIIPQPAAFGAGDFKESLLTNEALANVPAIKDEQVHVVESKHFTTLSHWNILGAESLARILRPDAFSEPLSPTFSLPE